jgi:hypothetical protein
VNSTDLQIEKESFEKLLANLITNSEGDKLQLLIFIIYYVHKADLKGLVTFLSEQIKIQLNKCNKAIVSEEEQNLKSLLSNDKLNILHDNPLLSKYIKDTKKDKFEEYLVIKENISESIKKEESSLNDLTNIRKVKFR